MCTTRKATSFMSWVLLGMFWGFFKNQSSYNHMLRNSFSSSTSKSIRGYCKTTQNVVQNSVTSTYCHLHSRHKLRTARQHLHDLLLSQAAFTRWGRCTRQLHMQKNTVTPSDNSAFSSSTDDFTIIIFRYRWII